MGPDIRGSTVRSKQCLTSKRCSRNEKPLRLIKERYSSCEYVDSWRGVHVHLGEGFHQPSLYHDGGMTFLVHPRVNID